MPNASPAPSWFLADLPLSNRCWDELSLRPELPPFRDGTRPRFLFYRLVAARGRERGISSLSSGELRLYALLQNIFRVIARRYLTEQEPFILRETGRFWRRDARDGFGRFSLLFARWYPPEAILDGSLTSEGYLTDPSEWRTRRESVLVELLLLKLSRENRAADGIRPLFDDREFASQTTYDRFLLPFLQRLQDAPVFSGTSLSLPELLRQPFIHAPHSLVHQLRWVQEKWGWLLPPAVLEELLLSLVEVEDEWRIHAPSGEPGGAPVLDFQRVDDHYPDFEAYSPDTDWMPNVVMLAKMVYVWLGQLSREYGVPITRLDQVPDRELDRIARRGFTALWLIGVWERSSASMKIKRFSGNPEAISSAYSLYDYVIARDLGGEEALLDLKRRAIQRGIRLASDMVPNHTGIYSRWILEHPDWFIQLEYPPYPSYRFNGPDLSDSPEVTIQIEDGYWDRSDAAVVFRLHDHRDGRTRYIYHGNDGTSTPWNDTAQLNYLLPEVREAVVGTIRHVASLFPIIRFDAAMTLAKKHYQRLWFPQPGHGGVASRADHGMSRERFDQLMPQEFWREVVDRMTAEVPDTLLLAEAFWLMEGYFVRTLGMHRVYNSAFMNMLKMEENAKYRLTIRNILEFDHRILQRFVNFMNNPDEKTAAEQFGTDRKYFGACVMLSTLPGLPLFGHGQIEGFHEKYGMEYHRAYWDEPVNEGLVREHERLVFPLLRRRRLFSGSEQFHLYDFLSGEGVDEDVYIYSNRVGDDRALIIYHNRHANCRGRIGQSVAKRDERGKLVRLSVCEGVGLEADGRHYYLVRDWADGLEYLFNGDEFRPGGAEFLLGPYQTRILMEWREVCDDEFCTWGTLRKRLGGRGVRSLDDEVKTVRFETEQVLFRDLLDRYVLPLVDGEAPVELLEQLGADLGKIARRGVTHGLLPPSPINLEELQGGCATLSSLRGESPLVEGELSLLLGSACLLITLLDRTVPSATPPFSRFLGLARVVEEYLFGHTPHSDDPLAPFSACELRTLLEIMLDWVGVRRDWGGDGETIASLLGDRRVSTFVGRHESGGVEWIVKERWDAVVRQLIVARAILATEPAATLVDRFQRLTSRARSAGYRVDRMVAAERDLSLSGGEGAGGESPVQGDAGDRHRLDDDVVDPAGEGQGEEDPLHETEIPEIP
ncbi:MAG: alpha-amylase family glycosyl hydrolase [Desulfuromonadia bacterium]